MTMHQDPAGSQGNSHLRVERDNGVMIVTLEKPEKMNALDPAMRTGIMTAVDDADSDDAIRVVILTGTGRGFCAGADVSRGPDAFVPASSGSEYRDGGGTLVRHLHEAATPIIAAVNGAAAGIGAAMLLGADIVYASTAARFGFVYTRRGIAPEGCSSFLLARAVGYPTALEWMLSGRVFDAQEAHSAGLVSRLLDPADLMTEAMTLARVIADETAPLSVAVTRQLIRRQLESSSIERAHELESLMIPWLVAHPDAREGVSAFIERRDPKFIGRPSELPERYPWKELADV